MATTMPWGETVEVLMDIGFPTQYFTLDNNPLGKLDIGGYLDGFDTVDVSAFVQDMTVSRGRSDQLSTINAGTASFVLINNDRRFDPINESSPYWNSVEGRTGMQPRRAVVVKINNVVVFSGRITDIDIVYDQDRSTVSIDASDDFVILANNAVEADVTFSAELSGARVENVLNLPEVDFPVSTRNIDAGTAQVGNYQIDANTNVLTYLQRVATAERGFFFVEAGGGLRFTNRSGYVFVTSAVEFADDGSGIGYATLGVSFGQEFLYNKVIAKRVGGTEQVVDDVASQNEYGISTLALPDLLLSADIDVGLLCADLLDLYKEPLYRFDGLTAVMNNLTNPERADVLGIELSDPILVKRSFSTGSPATVQKGFGVQRIVHRMTQTGHSVEFGLEVREVVNQFKLDDSTFGVLDAANALV